ncbi:MAG: glycosyltransferase family 8 protein [Oscillospiraceae bacterium]|jgi:lipopolysaccharide biosynthesis glycosyltransferase|nr:glycosyltransferase family 8 protein [Oscillospiraceae bacterium]
MELFRKPLDNARHWVIFVAVLAMLMQPSSAGAIGESVHIPIAMAADAGYLYPTIVALTSLFETAAESTRYAVTIMVPGNFKMEHANKILELLRTYERHSITFVNMGDAFETAYMDRPWGVPVTSPVYYRLLLPQVLAEEPKCIWIDGDTVTLQDLQRMYFIDMDKYDIAGAPSLTFRSQSLTSSEFEGSELLRAYGIDPSRWICSGVMLMNLEKMREDGCVQKFLDCMDKYPTLLHVQDESVLNVCCPFIRALPLKYGMFNCWPDLRALRFWTVGLLAPDELEQNGTEEEAPAIVHYACKQKPWLGVVAHDDLWWRFVEMTPHPDEIKAWVALKTEGRPRRRTLRMPTTW